MLNNAPYFEKPTLEASPLVELLQRNHTPEPPKPSRIWVVVGAITEEWKCPCGKTASEGGCIQGRYTVALRIQLMPIS